MKCWKCDVELEEDISYAEQYDNMRFFYCASSGCCSYYFINGNISFIQFETGNYYIYAEPLTNDTFIAVKDNRNKKARTKLYLRCPLDFLSLSSVMNNIKSFVSKLDTILLLK